MDNHGVACHYKPLGAVKFVIPVKAGIAGRCAGEYASAFQSPQMGRAPLRKAKTSNEGFRISQE